MEEAISTLGNIALIIMIVAFILALIGLIVAMLGYAYSCFQEYKEYRAAMNSTEWPPSR